MEEFNNKYILLTLFGMIGFMFIICICVYMCQYLRGLCRRNNIDIKEQSYIAGIDYQYNTYS